ncbi:hypothetical protein M9Y10_028893 [Tritrichomonas musculus]|uniref:Vacuolar sorting protein 39/Transforming growth factor beta receptor-associated zinc finger domain-containing protein n=1 Tax=Tritrichomonas musculus TaxID=1915356 RepID=A0ABR2KL35_9EUKA
MELTPHTIQQPEGIDISLIKGCCYFKNTIYLAYPAGFFFPLIYNSDSSGAPYEPPQEKYQLFQVSKEEKERERKEKLERERKGKKKEKGEDDEEVLGYEIRNMFSIQTPHLMILHYYKTIQTEKGAEERPSRVVVISPSMEQEDMNDKASFLSEECSLVATSFVEERREEQDSESRVIYPYLVVANGRKFMAYQCNGDEKNQAASDFFHKKMDKEYDTGSEIQAIGISKNAVCFYANNKYRTYWFENKDIAEVSQGFVTAPFVLPLTDNNFIIGNPKAMIISDKLGEKPSSLPYNKGYENIIPDDRPHDFMLYQGRLYQYFEQALLVGIVEPKMPTNAPSPFKLVNVPKIKYGCQRYDNADLFFITDDEMLTLGGVSYGSRLASKALDCGIDVALTCVQRIVDPADQMDVVVDMFKDLWVRDPDPPAQQNLMDQIQKEVAGEERKVEDRIKEKYKNAKLYAIKLVSNVLWRDDVREILSLFPVIMLSIPLEKRKRLDGCQPLENPSQEILSELGKFLLFTSENYKISNDGALSSQLSVLDTSLFEFYAMFHKTRELDSFMREPNSIDLQLVGKFFQQNKKPMRLYPALAIYNTRTDKPQEALSIWKTLDARDPTHTNKWAYEASYTLREIANNKIVGKHLAWVKDRDVSAAVNAFLYPKADVEFAEDWIKNNCENYLAKFYDYLTTQTDTPPKQTLIESAIDKFCKLLDEMSKPKSFDVHKLTYNEAALQYEGTPPRETIDLYANELANKIARIIRSIPNPKDYKECFDKNISVIKDTIKSSGNQHRWLLFEFYQISENYEMAMNDIFVGRPDFKELEEFCRNSPHPDVAFDFAFNRMRQDGKDILANNADFLIRNIEWVNMVNMLDWIPDETSLNQVDNIIQVASNFLIQKERFLELKNHIAKSMKKEADYKLVQARLRNVEIQHQTVCNACHRPVGNGWVAVAPDNRVYHISCKPKLPPRK